MVVAANMERDPLVVEVVRTRAEELAWFGKEGLKVAEVHSKCWSCYCTGLPAKVLVVDQPLNCSLVHS